MSYLINSIILFVLVSALVVIMSNRIERSVLALIMTFALAGLLFILIGVPFFGFIYLLVYTAAISILFLFVIMMLDIPQDPHRPLSPSVLSGGLFVSLGLFSGIFYTIILPLSPASNTHASVLTAMGHLFGQGLNGDKIERLVYHLEWGITKIETMQSIGYILYSEQVSLLLLIAVILLIVMVGIINHLYTAKTSNQ